MAVKQNWSSMDDEERKYLAESERRSPFLNSVNIRRNPKPSLRYVRRSVYARKHPQQRERDLHGEQGLHGFVVVVEQSSKLSTSQLESNVTFGRTITENV